MWPEIAKWIPPSPPLLPPPPPPAPRQRVLPAVGEDLERSQKQHDESMVSIESFIRSFDEQKDETLLRTMGQVDEHFRSVFGDLVRGGAPYDPT